MVYAMALPAIAAVLGAASRNRFAEPARQGPARLMTGGRKAVCR